jgi:hypothetical protein
MTEDPYVTLSTRDLEVKITDNRAYEGHRGGYNGIADLVHREQGKRVFVETLAGINYECIWLGDEEPPDRSALFEPRLAPMTLERLAETSACLYQPPTPYWRMETMAVYTVRPPHYVDVTVTYRPHRPARPRSFRTLWASYLNHPDDITLYLRGHTADNPTPRWLRISRAGHGPEFPLLAHETEALQGTPEWVWDDPFYYGRMQDFVFLLMFDRERTPCRSVGNGRRATPGRTRVAYSPTGGGSTPDIHRPAWDFEHYVESYQVLREYPFRLRLAYKPWAGQEDVLAEYANYQAFLRG